MIELCIQVDFDFLVYTTRQPGLITSSIGVVENSAEVSNRPHEVLFANDKRNLTLIRHLKAISSHFVLHNQLVRSLLPDSSLALEETDIFEACRELIPATSIKVCVTEEPHAIPIRSTAVLLPGESITLFSGVTFTFDSEHILTINITPESRSARHFAVVIY